MKRRKPLMGYSVYVTSPDTLHYLGKTEFSDRSQSIAELAKFFMSQPLQKAFPVSLLNIPARSWHQTGKVSCVTCPGGLYCCSQVLARRHTV
ncbi:MAG TPA: hypothetical protein V6C85_24240 [Allocoleopsis sp.]